MQWLDLYSDSVKRLCVKHKVRELYAFGSVLGTDFNEDSDIDLLVNFDSMDVKSYANNYFNLKFSLEDLFNRSVDLVEESALKNPYFKSSISNSRQLVYGGLNQDMVIWYSKRDQWNWWFFRGSSQRFYCIQKWYTDPSCCWAEFRNNWGGYK